MSRICRQRINGASYFFTVVTHERQTLLCDPFVRHLLREAFKEVSKRYPFRIDAWVLLPDHLHCIWTLPAGDQNILQRWSMLTRYVSVKYCQQRSQTRRDTGAERFTFWQPRVRGRRLRDDMDKRRHSKRIHIEPVKHGLCYTVNEWPFSSIHRHATAKQYQMDWPLVVQERRAQYAKR